MTKPLVVSTGRRGPAGSGPAPEDPLKVETRVQIPSGLPATARQRGARIYRTEKRPVRPASVSRPTRTLHERDRLAARARVDQEWADSPDGGRRGTPRKTPGSIATVTTQTTASAVMRHAVSVSAALCAGGVVVCLAQTDRCQRPQSARDRRADRHAHRLLVIRARRSVLSRLRRRHRSPDAASPRTRRRGGRLRHR